VTTSPGTPTPSTGTGATGPDPRRWRILAVTLAVGFMSLLDVTIVNVAIPSIRADLDTSAARIQWIVSGYSLAFGLMLVTGGRLGDAYGRKRLMLIGLSGFILASAAAGMAPTVDVLIAARLVQGVSAGLLTPQNTGLIQQLFSGAERGRAFGAFGFTVAVSSAIGPIVGGVILAVAGTDGWRWIFLVNVPIGLIALVAIAMMVPGRAEAASADPRLDLVGAALLGVAVLCLLLPVVSLEGGRRSPLLLLPAVPLLLWLFVRWERRLVRTGGAPLLDVGLLRATPGYASGVVVGSLYFTGFTGIFLVMSVFLQDGLGQTPLQAGLTLTPFAVGAAISAPLAGRWVSRIGRRITVLALTVMITGVVATALLVPLADRAAAPWLVLALPLLLAGLGGGGVVSPNFTLALADVQTRMGGAAGAALQTGQRLGASIGAAVLITVYQVALTGAGPGRAVQAALLVALVVLGLTWLTAWRDLRSSQV
jgi:EmrB/QacA subfamily drug resistance transporter